MQYCFIAGLMAASLGVQAQSVDVFGVTKNRDYRQTVADTVTYAGNHVYSFVEGSGFSAAFPDQPLTIRSPDGRSHALTYESDSSYRHEEVFSAEAEMEAAYGSGTYRIASGDHTYDLQLIGTYLPAPILSFSAGRWQNGVLVLTAQEADSSLTISSNSTSSNGFRSISVYSDTDTFRYFDYNDGGSLPPGAVVRSLGGGSLKPGHSYFVEIEFDNVVDGIAPQYGPLRNGYAIFSSATSVQVSVVPEPAALPLLASALAAAALVRVSRARRGSARRL